MPELRLTPAERQVVLERTEGIIVGLQTFASGVKGDNQDTMRDAWTEVGLGLLGLQNFIGDILPRSAQDCNAPGCDGTHTYQAVAVEDLPPQLREAAMDLIRRLQGDG